MALSVKSLYFTHSILRTSLASLWRRSYSSSITCKKLVIKEFGDPQKVVKLEEEILANPSEHEVVVQMLVASVNPADINTIQGVYPIKPDLPGVPGNEGVAKVVSVGSSVTSLCPGDWVIPDKEMFGTWRTHAVVKDEDLLKVPDDVPIIEMAGMASNTCTAYRMLKDFVSLKEGDVIIQNAANSAAGQNIIQICKAWGIKSINVVRNRPDIQDLKKYLTDLGATKVLTEEELRCTEIFKSGEIKAPCLALNGVGGKSGTEIMRKLSKRGVMVTYGGMSREPVILPTALFIFKDVQAKGFWMTRWRMENRTSEVRKQMTEEIMCLMKAGKLKAPAHKLLPITDYKQALENTLKSKGFAGCKYIFDFRT